MFSASRVLPRPSAVPMNTSQAAAETTIYAIPVILRGSFFEQEQEHAMASLLPFNEQI